VVDDDADVTSTFKMILEMNGFEVDAYTNPLSSNFTPNEFGLSNRGLGKSRSKNSRIVPTEADRQW
jgi:hypothetical protein